MIEYPPIPDMNETRPALQLYWKSVEDKFGPLIKAAYAEVIAFVASAEVKELFSAYHNYTFSVKKVNSKVLKESTLKKHRRNVDKFKLVETQYQEAKLNKDAKDANIKTLLADREAALRAIPEEILLTDKSNEFKMSQCYKFKDEFYILVQDSTNRANCYVDKRQVYARKDGEDLTPEDISFLTGMLPLGGGQSAWSNPDSKNPKYYNYGFVCDSSG